MRQSKVKFQSINRSANDSSGRSSEEQAKEGQLERGQLLLQEGQELRWIIAN